MDMCLFLLDLLVKKKIAIDLCNLTLHTLYTNVCISCKSIR